jgi:hypothetical protein
MQVRFQSLSFVTLHLQMLEPCYRFERLPTVILTVIQSTVHAQLVRLCHETA